MLPLLAATCLIAPVTPPDATLARRQVEEAEKAFAKTMADRDFAAFCTFIDEEAVFFSGPEPRRGKAAVIDWWKRYYQTPQAPFSWGPDRVEVLTSGTLALTSGPVQDPSGKKVGRFTSIWRQHKPGVWRIVFDKGDE